MFSFLEESRVGTTLLFPEGEEAYPNCLSRTEAVQLFEFLRAPPAVKDVADSF